MYEYNAKVEKVIDGDTIDVTIDLGFDITVKERIRFYGINAAEKNTDKGKDAKTHMIETLPIGTWVTLKTIKDKKEKYGRLLGVITLQDEAKTVLNDALVAGGYAVPYFGVGSKDNFVPN